MDALFHPLGTHVEACLPTLPHHATIVQLLQDGIHEELSNVLLYGAEGLSYLMLWDIAVRRALGTFPKNTHTWNKKWIYHETPHYFHIDLKDPSQPKDLHSLSDFLKEILSHHALNNLPRHIFILENIDVVADRNMTSIFRVILERYSKTAWFVCTTHRRGALEPPLLSRFFSVRVPLLQPEEIQHVLARMGKTFPPVLKGLLGSCRDLRFAVFMAECAEHERTLQFPLSTLASYHAPFLEELAFMKPAAATPEKIRALAHIAFVHGYSVRQVAEDLLAHVVKKPAARAWFIPFAAHVDHICAQTDRYRKVLYLEWLLFAAVQGVPPMHILLDTGGI